MRDAEEDRSDDPQGDELRPDNDDTRRSVQDALSQHHEMSGRCCQHNMLDRLGHALTRRCAARKHLKRKQDQNGKHTELGHVACDGGHENADGRGGVERLQNEGAGAADRGRDYHILNSRRHVAAGRQCRVDRE